MYTNDTSFTLHDNTWNAYNRIGIQCEFISKHNKTAEVLRPTLPKILLTALKKILLYASEVLSWNAKKVRSMSFVYNQAFFKIFKTFDPVVIRNCQFYMNILPFDLLLDLRRLHFLDNVNNAICYDYNDGQLVSLCRNMDLLNS